MEEEEEEEKEEEGVGGGGEKVRGRGEEGEVEGERMPQWHAFGQLLGTGPLLLPCRSQGSDSGCQTWQ